MKRIVLIFVTITSLGCNKDTQKLLTNTSDIEKEWGVDEIDTTFLPLDTMIRNIPTVSPWITYNIQKGKNFNSGVNYAALAEDSIVVEFSFDSTAIYKTAIPSNQEDWCKLVGFSDCNGFHQQNSSRITWRWAPQYELVEIGEYYYGNGKVQYSKLGEMAIGDTANASMYVTDSSYVISFNNILSQGVRKCNTKGNRYWLMPYFGGDEPSPQEINIHMRHVFPALAD